VFLHRGFCYDAAMKTRLMIFSLLVSLSNPLAAQDSEPAVDPAPTEVAEPKQTPDAVDVTESGDAEKTAQTTEPAKASSPPSPKDNALLEMVWEGDLAKVELVVLKGANVNVAGDKKRTPLMLAATKGHFDVVEFLYSKGADINAKDSDNQTALMYASRQRLNVVAENSIAFFLLNNGAEVNVRSKKKGFTTLMLASAAGNVKLVQQLLEKGADPTIRDNF